MLRKHALINNNAVTATVDLDLDAEDLDRSIFLVNQLVLDIHDLSPQPAIGWVLNGNKLELPLGNSDREAYEEILADKKTEFGIKLARLCINKIGARNKILNKSGAQVAALLNSLLSVKLLLETGALGTARASCVQLKVVYTEYSDIFDLIISQVNDFEQNFGL